MKANINTLRSITFLLLSLGCSISYLPAISQGNLDSLYYEKYKLIRNKNLDSAILIVRDGLSVTRANSLLEIKFYNALGWCYGQKKDQSKSIHFYKVGLGIAIKTDNQEWITHLSNVIGVAYQEISKLDSSLHFYLISIQAAKKQNNSIDLGIGLCNIGYVYYKLEYLDEAISYLNKSILALQKSEEGKEFLIPTYINLGMSYAKKGDKDKSIEFFNEAEKICFANPPLCTPKMKLDIHYNLGLLFFENHDITRAEVQLKESYQESKELHALFPLSTVTYYLAKIATIKKNYGLARKWLKESDIYALQIHSVERQKNNAGLWADIFEKMLKYDSSIIKRKEYEMLKDSIFREELVSSLKEINIQEQKELSEVAILQKETIINNRTTVLYLLGVVLVLTSALLYFVYARYNDKKVTAQLLETTVKTRTSELQKSNEQLMISRKDLDTFIYRLSHNIRGPLATLLGLTNVAKTDVHEPAAGDIISKIASTAIKLNDTLTELITINQLLNSKLESTEINLNSVIMSARVLNKEREQYPLIKWSTRFEENASLVYTDKPTLQIIFNKIIDNCYKYFDHNKVNNYISITSNVSLDKNSVIVSIEDNGIGIEESAQDKIFDVFYIATERGGAGLGLFHARLAAEKIGISILNTNRKSPTIFEVHIPLQAKFRN